MQDSRLPQSRSQCSQSEDHILIHEREWIDVTNTTWESVSWNLFMRLVRRVDPQQRESDVAFHWTSMSSKLRHAFLKDGGDTFSDDEWIDHTWKRSSKTRFQYCKNSYNDLSYIFTIQGHWRRSDST